MTIESGGKRIPWRGEPANSAQLDALARVIGGQAFGLVDWPVEKTGRELAAILGFLVKSPSTQVLAVSTPTGPGILLDRESAQMLVQAMYRLAELLDSDTRLG